MLTRRFLGIISIALASVFVAEKSASAGFNAQLLNTYGNNTTIRLYYQELQGSTYVNKSVSAKAVQFTWSVKSGTAPSTQTFQSYCIDLIQSVTNTQSFGITDLTNAPNPNRGNLINSTRAAMIEAYWAQNIAKVVTKNDASAFQIGLWELVFERTDDPSKLDVKKGNFYVGIDKYDSTYKDILNKANSWLKGTDYSLSAPHQTNLVAITTPNGQDQVTPGTEPTPNTPTSVVPAPPALLLALLGILGFGSIGGMRKHFWA